mgnify:CR=1 FL=1
MRVLLCSNFYYRRGGDCTYLLALQALLERHGHETAVFSMRHPQNLPCPQEKYFIDFLDYAALNREKTPWNAVKVLGRSLWSFQARRNIARLIADWRPDVAHFQNIHAYLTPSILGPLTAAGVPVVWSLHDYKLICPNDNFYSNGRICEDCLGGRFWQCARNRCKKGSRAASAVASLEAYVHRLLGVGRRAARFIVPSEFLWRQFVKYGYAPERFVVLPHFLEGDPPPNAVSGAYGLYSGTLMPFKGVGTLLQALARTTPHPFHILGGGERLETYRRQARELGLTQVQFRGFLTGAELAAEQAGAAYAVVPSEWYETFSYAAQEPLARGVPVVASNLGALPELVRDGETGLLFPHGDAVALADRIERIWQDGGLRSRLGAQARRAMLAKCAVDQYYPALLKVYENVCAPASPGQE